MLATPLPWRDIWCRSSPASPSLNILKKIYRMLFVLAIASFGIAIGAIWEIIEWLTGSINSLNDTIMDLVMDTTGSTVAALVSLWALQERTHREST
jgi:hypothetical protein